MTALKIKICAATAGIALIAFTNASAGTIGGTDWNNWQETAGLPAARYSMAAGVLHGAIGFSTICKSTYI